MKKSTKTVLIGGYVIFIGMVSSISGNGPLEVIGNIMCGVGLALVMRGIELLIADVD